VQRIIALALPRQAYLSNIPRFNKPCNTKYHVKEIRYSQQIKMARCLATLLSLQFLFLHSFASINTFVSNFEGGSGGPNSREYFLTPRIIALRYNACTGHKFVVKKLRPLFGSLPAESRYTNSTTCILGVPPLNPPYQRRPLP